MTQLSRPFQIALVALALLVLVWFGALHRPGSGSSNSSSSPSAAQSASSSAAAHKRSVHTGSVTTKVAHHSVHVSASPGHHLKTSTGQAAHTTGQSSHTSGSVHTKPSVSAHRHTSTHAAGSGAGVRAPGKASTTPRAAQPGQGGPTAAAKAKAPSTPALQAAVAGELKHGKVVLLLFWNPHSSDDALVHQQVQAVAHKLGGHVVVHTASAGQVGAFGSITRDIQIYQTPTLLIVNPKKQVTTMTGYTEAFAIEQAIREARG